MKKKLTSDGWVIQRPIHTNVTGAMLYRAPNFAKYPVISISLIDEEQGKRLGHAKDANLAIVHTRKEQFWETIYTHEAVFYSESRQCRWKKGEKESGNILLLLDIFINCYGNSLLYIVKQTRPEVGFCHHGKPTCFYRSVFTGVFEDDGHTTLSVIPINTKVGS